MCTIANISGYGILTNSAKRYRLLTRWKAFSTSQHNHRDCLMYIQSYLPKHHSSTAENELISDEKIWREIKQAFSYRTKHKQICWSKIRNRSLEDVLPKPHPHQSATACTSKPRRHLTSESTGIIINSASVNSPFASRCHPIRSHALGRNPSDYLMMQYLAV